MRILCLDTSARSLTAGIAEQAGSARSCRGVWLPDCGLTHSEIMMAEVDRLLEREGLAMRDFDAFAAVVGPGSFTGIRIGVTTVRALCQVLERECVAVNALEIMAYGAGARLCAADAMHGKLYYAAYAEDGRELCAPSVCERQEFGAVRERYPYPLYARCGLEGELAPGDALSQLCECCLDRALSGGLTDYRELQPLYVRTSQAEETLRSQTQAGQ